MGVYFNKNRGPLPLTVGPGKSASVPGKGLIELHGEEEHSEAVLAALRAGDLLKMPEPALVEPAPVAAPVEVPTVEAAPVVTEVLPEAAMPVVDAPIESGSMITEQANRKKGKR